jgi:hypothetical protein
MKATLARLEAQHEALIAALDANDINAMESVSRSLGDDLQALRGSASWFAEPELKQAAERIGRLAEAALQRVNVLQDCAARRGEALAAVRGQARPTLYTR